MLISAAKIRSQKFVVFGGISAPDYSISHGDSVNEGQVATFNITTFNVANGTTLYWTLSGTTDAIDFVDNVASGSTTVSSNSATVTVTLKNDELTEGIEYVVLQLRTGSTAGPIVAQSNFLNVIDTSLTRSYTITPAAYSVNEGDPITFNVTTANVPDSTTIYWNLTNALDFTVSSGNFQISSNAGSFSVTPSLDLTTEGTETFTASLRVTIGGVVVATSDPVTINDTSTTPIPSYSVTASANPVNEGVSVTFTTNTANVADGTTLYWTNTGTANATDIGGSNNGSFSITSNVGSVTLGIAADQTTEGSETIIFNVKTVSISGDTVAQAGVTINDTSVNPPPGCCICFGVVGAGGGGGFTCPTASYNIAGGGGGGGDVKECCTVTFCTNMWFTFCVGRGGSGGSSAGAPNVGQGTVFGCGMPGANPNPSLGVSACGGQAGRRANNPFPSTVAAAPLGGGGGGRIGSPSVLDGPTSFSCFSGGCGAWAPAQPNGAGGGGGAGKGGAGTPASGLNGGPGGPGFCSPIVGKIFSRGGLGGGATARGGSPGSHPTSPDPSLSCQWGTGGCGGAGPAGSGTQGTPGAVYFKIPDAYSVAISNPPAINCVIYCGGDGFKCYVIGHVSNPILNCICFYLG